MQGECTDNVSNKLGNVKHEQIHEGREDGRKKEITGN